MPAAVGVRGADGAHLRIPCSQPGSRAGGCESAGDRSCSVGAGDPGSAGTAREFPREGVRAQDRGNTAVPAADGSRGTAHGDTGIAETVRG